MPLVTFTGVAVNPAPLHTEDVMAVIAGVGFTVTAIVELALPQPITETKTLYVPAIAGITGANVGFCIDDVKLFGPVQLYVAPETLADVKLNVCPIQDGLVAVKLGDPGIP